MIDPTWAAHRVARLPRYAFGVLTEHADALLRDLEGSKSVRGRVEGLLMPVLHTGNANMDAVAGKLGMSRQTLFRKLKAEGATFEKVLDELRHRMAADYLGARKVSVNETAYLVGLLRAGGVFARLQALDGIQPPRHARRRKRRAGPRLNRRPLRSRRPETWGQVFGLPRHGRRSPHR